MHHAQSGIKRAEEVKFSEQTKLNSESRRILIRGADDASLGGKRTGAHLLLNSKKTLTVELLENVTSSRFLVGQHH